jgi:hypothetical protein
MTREEVRQQLKENPLVWDCTDPFDRDGDSVIDHYAEIVEISADADVYYTIREVFDDNGSRTRAVLYLTTIDVVQHMYSPYEVVLSVYDDISVDEIKSLAEAKRLESTCRLLRIKD